MAQAALPYSASFPGHATDEVAARSYRQGRADAALRGPLEGITIEQAAGWRLTNPAAWDALVEVSRAALDYINNGGGAEAPVLRAALYDAVDAFTLRMPAQVAA